MDDARRAVAARELSRAIVEAHRDDWASLHPDRADLIQKAGNGPSIPRTTLRYAIERFPARKRRKLLKATTRPGRTSAQAAAHAAR